MDLQICSLLSVLEVAALAGLKELLPLTSTVRTERLKIFLLLFVLQYGLVKIYRIFIRPIFLSPLRHLPGPKGDHFMLGQLLNQYRGSSPHELFLKWAALWPDSPFIRHFGFANSEYLLVNGVNAYREVLQTNCYAFKKPEHFMRFVGEIAGTGLLFAEGEEHKKQRRMILNVFSVPNLKKMFPVFQEKAAELEAYLDKKRAESPTGTVEVMDAFSKATIDVIGVTSLGVELRNLRSSNLDLDFLQCYRRLFDQSYLAALISFINVAVPVRRLLWFVPANRDFVEATREIQAMLRQVIEERIRDVAAQGKGGSETKPLSRDLLTFMVEEKLKGEEPLTMDMMLGHLLNFLSAGHETTSASMTWAAYVLATKPDVQGKLRAEVMALLQDNPNPSYAEIERLPYLNKFVKELFRLYSPAIVTHREAAQDVVICGRRLPKGTSLVLSPPVVNLSRKVWGDDATEFVPERWDRLEGEAATAYSVMSFLAGPRQCIGKQYAAVEVKVLLARVVAGFRLLPGEELERRRMHVPLRNPGIVLRPRGGLRVRFERL